MKLYILLFIFIFFLPFVYAEKITYQMHFVGNSMLPTLKPGFQNVQTISRNNIEINDIICFNPQYKTLKSNIRYICHRVMKLNNTHACTKGDNNYLYDPCIEKKYVALKVIH